MEASGKFQIQFPKYSNPNCFDRWPGIDCDFYFENFNLKIDGVVVQARSSIVLPDNTNIVDLTGVDYFRNPLNVSFPANAMFTFSFEVWKEYSLRTTHIQDFKVRVTNWDLLKKSVSTVLDG